MTIVRNSISENHHRKTAATTRLKGFGLTHHKCHQPGRQQHFTLYFHANAPVICQRQVPKLTVMVNANDRICVTQQDMAVSRP